MDYSKTNKKFLEDIFTDFNTVQFFNSLISSLPFANSDFNLVS